MVKIRSDSERNLHKKEAVGLSKSNRFILVIFDIYDLNTGKSDFHGDLWRLMSSGVKLVLR